MYTLARKNSIVLVAYDEDDGGRKSVSDIIEWQGQTDLVKLARRKHFKDVTNKFKHYEIHVIK